MRECDWCQEVKLCGDVEESGEVHTICADCTVYYAIQANIAASVTQQVADAFDDL